MFWVGLAFEPRQKDIDICFFRLHYTSFQCSGSFSSLYRSSNSTYRKCFTWFIPVIVVLTADVQRFLPIVGLALVFNITNVIGFTYACVPAHLSTTTYTNGTVGYSDRDAKQRWAASAAAGGWNMGLGGIGGSIMGSVVRNSVGRAFGL